MNPHIPVTVRQEKDIYSSDIGRAAAPSCPKIISGTASLRTNFGTPAR